MIAVAVDQRERGFEAEAQDAADGQRDEERPRLHFERAGGEHERRERKRRRNQIEHGERDRRPSSRTRARIASRRLAGTQRSSPCSPILTPIQKVSAAPAIDPAVASSGTIHHSVAQPRGEDDHGGVDAERQREEQRRVERGEDDDAGR